MATNSLCALVGHAPVVTAENTATVFWLVPPSICAHCGTLFEGVQGIPPANRPREAYRKPRTIKQKVALDA